jgi:hypothetical protein
MQQQINTDSLVIGSGADEAAFETKKIRLER